MGVLDGVRVVEMGMWIAGPATGGILADWGAEVIKIESPSGDPMRGLYGALVGSKEQRCPPFDLHNRGKRSVALDVNRPESAEVVDRLIARADVFITNMRPAFLERVGLDHQRLLAQNPRLVYASLTGYGLEGPDRDAPGYDMAAFGARAGVSDRSTPPGEPPVMLAMGIGDTVTGMATVAAILAALLHRERTGQGQLVATSLLRAGAYCIGSELATRLSLGKLAAPQRRTAPQNPLLNSYRAGDQKWFWLIGAEADRHWPGLVAALDDSRLLDEEYATARGRRRASEALIAILDEIFARRTREEWARRFEDHDVWWAPVNSVEDLLTDRQAQAAGVFVDVPNGRTTNAENAEVVTSVATPVDFQTVSGPSAGPPAIGGDTVAVLRDLGMDEGELRRLHDEGILHSPEPLSTAARP